MFVKFAQFHPLGVYSNYVERRPFDGLLCKYNHACAWLPIVFAFHPFGCFLCRPPLVAAVPAGQLLCSLWLGKGLVVWGASTLAFLDCSKVNRKPASRLF